KRLRKGLVIDQPAMQRLTWAGIDTVTVARLDDDDIHEDLAAEQIASAICGTGVVADTATTGRVNLFAAHDGLLCFDRQLIEAINSVDESITFATLPQDTWVLSGRMVATSKIITYAVPQPALAQVMAKITRHICVEAVGSHRATLIQTQLPAVKPSVLDKTASVTQRRLAARNASLLQELRCEHDTEALTATLKSVDDGDWILIAGASAISDRRDVIPAAIVAAGGSVSRYGIPVDPGNLLLLGEIHGRTVLGLPGCARSPRLNGLDLLLNRMACGVAITDEWLNSLSVGGLLAEMVDRPQPRVQDNNAGASADHAANIAALILAAGSSKRAGGINKLLFEVNGVSLVRSVADKVCSSALSPVVAVTGHQHQQVEEALHGVICTVVYCPTYEQGMAHSLSFGISQLTQADAVMVFLGDMPDVSASVIDAMLKCNDGDVREVIRVPVYNGRRGNPVMVGRAFFDSLLQHTGDTGARFLMRQYPERVVEVQVSDAAVLIDYDTPESLAALANPDATHE
ncbi:MAG: molybdopterin-binding/glycosyltransferase family 2 protein, partial [Pseudomonadota bacterium]